MLILINATRRLLKYRIYVTLNLNLAAQEKYILTQIRFPIGGERVTCRGSKLALSP